MSVENLTYPYRSTVFKLENENSDIVRLNDIEIEDKRQNITLNNNALRFMRNKKNTNNVDNTDIVVEDLEDLNIKIIPSTSTTTTSTTTTTTTTTTVKNIYSMDFITPTLLTEEINTTTSTTTLSEYPSITTLYDSSIIPSDITTTTTTKLQTIRRNIIGKSIVNDSIMISNLSNVDLNTNIETQDVELSGYVYKLEKEESTPFINYSSTYQQGILTNTTFDNNNDLLISSSTSSPTTFDAIIIPKTEYTLSSSQEISVSNNQICDEYFDTNNLSHPVLNTSASSTQTVKTTNNIYDVTQLLNAKISGNGSGVFSNASSLTVSAGMFNPSVTLTRPSSSTSSTTTTIHYYTLYNSTTLTTTEPEYSDIMSEFDAEITITKTYDTLTDTYYYYPLNLNAIQNTYTTCNASDTHGRDVYNNKFVNSLTTSRTITTSTKINSTSVIFGNNTAEISTTPTTTSTTFNITNDIAVPSSSVHDSIFDYNIVTDGFLSTNDLIAGSTSSNINYFPTSATTNAIIKSSLCLHDTATGPDFDINDIYYGNIIMQEFTKPTYLQDTDLNKMFCNVTSKYSSPSSVGMIYNYSSSTYTQIYFDTQVDTSSLVNTHNYIDYIEFRNINVTFYDGSTKTLASLIVPISTGSNSYNVTYNVIQYGVTLPIYNKLDNTTIPALSSIKYTRENISVDSKIWYLNYTFPFKITSGKTLLNETTDYTVHISDTTNPATLTEISLGGSSEGYNFVLSQPIQSDFYTIGYPVYDGTNIVFSSSSSVKKYDMSYYLSYYKAEITYKNFKQHYKNSFYSSPTTLNTTPHIDVSTLPITISSGRYSTTSTTLTTPLHYNPYTLNPDGSKHNYYLPTTTAIEFDSNTFNICLKFPISSNPYILTSSDTSNETFNPTFTIPNYIASTEINKAITCEEFANYITSTTVKYNTSNSQTLYEYNTTLGETAYTTTPPTPKIKIYKKNFISDFVLEININGTEKIIYPLKYNTYADKEQYKSSSSTTGLIISSSTFSSSHLYNVYSKDNTNNSICSDLMVNNEIYCSLNDTTFNEFYINIAYTTNVTLNFSIYSLSDPSIQLTNFTTTKYTTSFTPYLGDVQINALGSYLVTIDLNDLYNKCFTYDDVEYYLIKYTDTEVYTPSESLSINTTDGTEQTIYVTTNTTTTKTKTKELDSYYCGTFQTANYSSGYSGTIEELNMVMSDYVYGNYLHRFLFLNSTGNTYYDDGGSKTWLNDYSYTYQSDPATFTLTSFLTENDKLTISYSTITIPQLSIKVQSTITTNLDYKLYVSQKLEDNNAYNLPYTNSQYQISGSLNRFSGGNNSYTSKYSNITYKNLTTSSKLGKDGYWYHSPSIDYMTMSKGYTDSIRCSPITASYTYTDGTDTETGTIELNCTIDEIKKIYTLFNRQKSTGSKENEMLRELILEFIPTFNFTFKTNIYKIQIPEVQTLTGYDSFVNTVQTSDEVDYNTYPIDNFTFGNYETSLKNSTFKFKNVDSNKNVFGYDIKKSISPITTISNVKINNSEYYEKNISTNYKNILSSGTIVYEESIINSTTYTTTTTLSEDIKITSLTILQPNSKILKNSIINSTVIEEDINIETLCCLFTNTNFVNFIGSEPTKTHIDSLTTLTHFPLNPTDYTSYLATEGLIYPSTNTIIKFGSNINNYTYLSNKQINTIIRFSSTSEQEINISQIDNGDNIVKLDFDINYFSSDSYGLLKRSNLTTYTQNGYKTIKSGSVIYPGNYIIKNNQSVISDILIIESEALNYTFDIPNNSTIAANSYLGAGSSYLDINGNTVKISSSNDLVLANYGILKFGLTVAEGSNICKNYYSTSTTLTYDEIINTFDDGVYKSLIKKGSVINSFPPVTLMKDCYLCYKTGELITSDIIVGKRNIDKSLIPTSNIIAVYDNNFYYTSSYSNTATTTTNNIIIAYKKDDKINFIALTTEEFLKYEYLLAKNSLIKAGSIINNNSYTTDTILTTSIKIYSYTKILSGSKLYGSITPQTSTNETSTNETYETQLEETSIISGKFLITSNEKNINTSSDCIIINTDFDTETLQPYYEISEDLIINSMCTIIGQTVPTLNNYNENFSYLSYNSIIDVSNFNYSSSDYSYIDYQAELENDNINIFSQISQQSLSNVDTENEDSETYIKKLIINNVKPNYYIKTHFEIFAKIGDIKAFATKKDSNKYSISLLPTFTAYSIYNAILFSFTHQPVNYKDRINTETININFTFYNINDVEDNNFTDALITKVNNLITLPYSTNPNATTAEAWHKAYECIGFHYTIEDDITDSSLIESTNFKNTFSASCEGEGNYNNLNSSLINIDETNIFFYKSDSDYFIYESENNKYLYQHILTSTLSTLQLYVYVIIKNYDTYKISEPYYYYPDDYDHKDYNTLLTNNCLSSTYNIYNISINLHSTQSIINNTFTIILDSSKLKLILPTDLTLAMQNITSNDVTYYYNNMTYKYNSLGFYNFDYYNMNSSVSYTTHITETTNTLYDNSLQVAFNLYSNNNGSLKMFCRIIMDICESCCSDYTSQNYTSQQYNYAFHTIALKKLLNYYSNGQLSTSNKINNLRFYDADYNNLTQTEFVNLLGNANNLGGNFDVYILQQYYTSNSYIQKLTYTNTEPFEYFWFDLDYLNTRQYVSYINSYPIDYKNALKNISATNYKTSIETAFEYKNCSMCSAANCCDISEIDNSAISDNNSSSYEPKTEMTYGNMQIYRNNLSKTPIYITTMVPNNFILLPNDTSQCQLTTGTINFENEGTILQTNTYSTYLEDGEFIIKIISTSGTETKTLTEQIQHISVGLDNETGTTNYISAGSIIAPSSQINGITYDTETVITEGNEITIYMKSVIKAGSTLAVNSVINDTLYDYNAYIISDIEIIPKFVYSSISNFDNDYKESTEGLTINSGTLKANSTISAGSIINSTTYLISTILDSNIVISSKTILNPNSIIYSGSIINVPDNIYNLKTGTDIILTENLTLNPKTYTTSTLYQLVPQRIYYTFYLPILTESGNFDKLNNFDVVINNLLITYKSYEYTQDDLPANLLKTKIYISDTETINNTTLTSSQTKIKTNSTFAANSQINTTTITTAKEFINYLTSSSTINAYSIINGTLLTEDKQPSWYIGPLDTVGEGTKIINGELMTTVDSNILNAKTLIPKNGIIFNPGDLILPFEYGEIELIYDTIFFKNTEIVYSDSSKQTITKSYLIIPKGTKLKSFSVKDYIISNKITLYDTQAFIKNTSSGEIENIKPYKTLIKTGSRINNILITSDTLLTTSTTITTSATTLMSESENIDIKYYVFENNTFIEKEDKYDSLTTDLTISPNIDLTGNSKIQFSEKSILNNSCFGLTVPEIGVLYLIGKLILSDEDLIISGSIVDGEINFISYASNTITENINVSDYIYLDVGNIISKNSIISAGSILNGETLETTTTITSDVETTNSVTDKNIYIDTIYIEPGRYKTIEELITNINKSLRSSFEDNLNIETKEITFKDEVYINLEIPRILKLVDSNNWIYNLSFEYDMFNIHDLSITINKNDKLKLNIKNGDTTYKGIAEYGEDEPLVINFKNQDYSNWTLDDYMLTDNDFNYIYDYNVSKTLTFENYIISDNINDELISKIILDNTDFITLSSSSRSSNSRYTYTFATEILPIEFTEDDIPENVNYMKLIKTYQNYNSPVGGNNEMLEFEVKNKDIEATEEEAKDYINKYITSEKYYLNFKQNSSGLWHKLGFDTVKINKSDRPKIINLDTIDIEIDTAAYYSYENMIWYNILSSNFTETVFTGDTVYYPHMYNNVEGWNTLAPFSSIWEAERCINLKLPTTFNIKFSTTENVEYGLNIGNSNQSLSEIKSFTKDSENNTLKFLIYKTLDISKVKTLWIYIDSTEHYPFEIGTNAILNVEFN